MQLDALGWNPRFAAALELSETTDALPARVACVHRDRLDLFTEAGPLSGRVSGRFRNRTTRDDAWPTAGDWVAYTPSPDGDFGVVHAVLDRATCLFRRAAATSDVQVLAANLDRVFVVTSATREFNARRVERFLSIVWESGASPVLALTKVDVAEAPLESYLAELATVGLGVPTFALSVHSGEGVDEWLASFEPGMTTAFVGSSGVGKSTLVNHLGGGDLLDVGATREVDGKGRHTTTRRELVVVDGRGVLIDTPGLRGLGLIDAEDGVGDAFADVEVLMGACKFSDCGHDTEPGCAVQAAVAAGELDAARLASYRKLLRELEAERARTDPVLARERQNRWKAITKSMRHHPSKKGK